MSLCSSREEAHQFLVLLLLVSDLLGGAAARCCWQVRVLWLRERIVVALLLTVPFALQLGLLLRLGLDLVVVEELKQILQMLLLFLLLEALVL